MNVVPVAMAAAMLALAPRIVAPGPLGADAQTSPETAPISEDALRTLVREVLAPALPYPAAREDGTPADGDPRTRWSVLWPGAGHDIRIEVVANPLNAEYQAEAARAEQQIQASAMRAQRQSQDDYERALAEFARGGSPSPIREVSLDDEGVAGERFDAESRLLVIVETGPDAADDVVETSVAPIVDARVEGAIVIRVPANVYARPVAPGEAESVHFAPAQARLAFGGFGPPEIRPVDGRDAFDVSIPRQGEGRHVVVSLSGNATLLQDVLERADWSLIRALVGS